MNTTQDKKATTMATSELYTAIMSSQHEKLKDYIRKCKSEAETLYVYDRYMKMLLGEMMYTKNENLKPILLREYNEIHINIDIVALKALNKLKQTLIKN